jgi:PilZ domain
MLKDLRKARRRPMRYAAWIALKPGELHGCVLSDISETGARIDVEDSKKIPDRFQLFLSRAGAARRLCKVVWRKPKQVGVTFAAPFAAADRANLVPKIEGNVASPPLAPEADAGKEPAENA